MPMMTGKMPERPMKRELFCRPLSCAHDWVGRIVAAGDRVVDATAGNGYDSVFLAGLVGKGGCVHVFDIQQAALDATRARLDEHGFLDGRVRLHRCCHAQMGVHVDGPVRAVMFNLGYLPGGDKRIISGTQTTVNALNSAMDLLVAGGILTVVCYPGHEGGDEESLAVEGLLEARAAEGWDVTKVATLGRMRKPPFLIAALKTGSMRACPGETC